MSQTEGKRSSGEKFKAPPAQIWNNMVDAGRAWADGQLNSGAPDRSRSRPTDIIKVKNETGANRARGQVVCFNGFILTDLDPDAIWLRGVETIRGRHFAVLKYDVSVDEIVDAQISGVCVGSVNITNIAHRCARLPSNGTHVLQSCFSGPVELLWTPSTTGVRDCAINIRRESMPIFKTPSGGIPARSGTTCGTANCTPYTINDAGVLVELRAYGGGALAVPVHSIFSEAIGSEVYITAKDIYGMLVVDSEDCG
jgi:hypothetical protein